MTARLFTSASFDVPHLVKPVRKDRTPVEGYVLHSYGSEHHLLHAVASVVTLRRYDKKRPVALFCPPGHRAALERRGLTPVFNHIRELPENHRSIVGFKHHLHKFKLFEECLFVDADMVWCRNPDPLWQQFRSYDFTTTGKEKADLFFGASKGPGVVINYLLNRRRRTLRRFDLTYLSRVQGGMIYTGDEDLTEKVCRQAARYLDHADETHFRSRRSEKSRGEETCEWSLAMAMSRYRLPVFPWRQGHRSPQLDYVDGFVEHDLDFRNVSCRYYSSTGVHELRGLPDGWIRSGLVALLSALPGRGDYMEVTPFALHFSWQDRKQPFYDFAARVWHRLERQRKQLKASSQKTRSAPNQKRPNEKQARERANGKTEAPEKVRG